MTNDSTRLFRKCTQVVVSYQKMIQNGVNLQKAFLARDIEVFLHLIPKTGGALRNICQCYRMVNMPGFASYDRN